MAEFNRSLSTPIEARNRSRNHVSCPRCRVDPSHISRQFWEATRPQHHQQDLSNNNVLEVRPAGYPDLCRRSNRSYTSPASVHQFQQRPASNTISGYYTLSTNNAGSMRYSSDTHSTRSAGDTWRIRGILENHPPDVTRRAESSMGRLPDVTHHTQSTLPIQHARTRSVPVGGVYDSRVPSNSSYDIHLQHQPPMVSRSSTQGIICARNNPETLSHTSLPAASNTVSHNRHQVNTVTHRPEPLPSTSVINTQWKREHHHTSTSNNSSSSPWVTMDRQQVNRNTNLDRQLTLDRQLNASASSSSPNTNNNSLTWSNQPQNTNHNSSGSTSNNTGNTSSCWRPNTVTSPSQNVLSPCPLPDLVTPRRQARKQCCGLLATHSVAIRWLVVVIAALGLLCSVVGTIVGVVRVTGREHLTVALLLIGKSF